MKQFTASNFKGNCTIHDDINVNDMTAWMTKYNEIRGIESENLA